MYQEKSAEAASQTNGCGDRARRNPGESRVAAARAEAVEERQRQDDQDEQGRPAGDADQRIRPGADSEMAEDEGRDDHRAEREDQSEDRAKREGQGDKGQADEASLLRLAIGDVEAVHHRLGSGVGAPQSEQKAADEAEAERRGPVRGQPRQLLVDDGERAVREDARHQRQMVMDRRGVGDEAVKRDEGGHGRKDREKTIEHDARRDREQAVRR